jgi:transposase InsO family protein
MPWGVKEKVELRKEFVSRAKAKEKSFRQLCGEYGISRKTGYKWVGRDTQGLEPEDQSRRPHQSRNQTGEGVERLVLDVRKAHPAWGAKKIRQVLLNEGKEGIPASSTITTILKRNGMIDERESLKHTPFHKFESEAPNDLWQADFKGNKGHARLVGCHPLTVLDDHSRYNIGLRSCPNERKETVQQEFSGMFREYGMPLRILTDNGSPWGSVGTDEPHTAISVWLMILGIGIIHGRPCHPQTQGKDERFNRSLKDEVMSHHFPESLTGYQQIFDEWRQIYNNVRPHEGIGMKVPADRYRPSPREFPEKLPAVVYDEGLELRKTDINGWISFRSNYWRVGKPFRGHYVAVKPTETDGVFDVMFMDFCVSSIDLRENRRRP